MIRLSAFADEVAANLKDQMDILESQGVRYIELRGVWGKNVKDLTDADVERVKAETTSRGFGIAALGAPTGKVGINDDFHKHLNEFRRLVEIAKRLDCRLIRVFSFFMPSGEDPAKYRADCIGKLKILRDVAVENDIIMCHENEKEIYGDTGDRCLDLMKELYSDHFAAVFDPANFVQCHQAPWDDCYTKLKGYIRHFHVKDAVMADGHVVPAGQGDGDVKRILSDLIASGYDGFLSLEPHLSVAGKSHGVTKPDLFAVATKALKSILDEIGASYQ